MKITSQQLLDDLAGLTKQHVSFVQKLQALPDKLLTQKAQPASWNALECIEHLNRYGNFYLPEIRKRIAESTTHTAPVFKSGWLGNYFANSMLPKDKLNKMRTFEVMNPANSTLDRRSFKRLPGSYKPCWSYCAWLQRPTSIKYAPPSAFPPLFD
ncbi:hypothetical protein KRR40_22825 [Niabella defluvii]|nr:hypothetical protein KRR40_22825 [Niabella sp. I65]